MSMKHRLTRLEQVHGEDPGVAIIYVGDDKDKAIAEYKASHPGWEPSERDIHYIHVNSEYARALTLRILAGERTE